MNKKEKKNQIKRLETCKNIKLKEKILKVPK